MPFYRCTGARKDLQAAPPLLRPGGHRHLPTACRRHEPHPTTQLSMVKYKGAKLHHLAGKVSKSCYKLREDRVAHHL